MWRRGAISLWKSRSSARQAYRRCCDSTAYVQELFQDLRHFSQLPRPHDAQPLARLAFRGAQLTPELTPRQRALLAQRLEGLDWCSWEVCEALGEDAESYVDNLLPAEWMLLLRYFTSCGFVHHGFCQAAAAWLQFHEASGKLQLKQLQELLSSLAYAGHLTRELGEEVCKTLKPLPTEAEEQVLVRLATTLASVDVETPEFYRQVLSTVTAPKTVPAGLPAGGAEEAEDYWRLSLLCFLAKADVVRWSLLLNILRQLNPLVAESVPQTLIPRLLWHLHQNCLENDSLLLEARPLAKQLATQLTAAKRRWASEDLATMAGSLGYLGIIDVRCSEAIWEQLEAAEEEEVAPAMLQAGWAACVASSASSQGLGAGHQCLQRQRHALVAALAATKPLERLAQQRRQVALSLQAVQALQQANAADENEPPVMPGRAFFTPHRQKDQLRIARAFTARLRSLGAYCRAKPSWEAVAYDHLKGAQVEPRKDARGRQSTKAQRHASASMAAKDTFVVVYTHKGNGEQIGDSKEEKPQKIVLRVTLWVKHPLLLAEGDRADLDGAKVQGCCLNGFEAIEWWLTKLRPPELQSGKDIEHILLLMRSDSTTHAV